MLEDAIFNKVRIDYIELNVRSIEKSKTFYTHLGWSFIDYGDQYCEFDSGGFKGGFAQVDEVQANRGALVILYTEQLQRTMDIIKLAGGHIIKPIFDFTDPDGYELGIWSDH